MPLDAGHLWRRDAALSADEIFAALASHFRLTADPAPRGSAPARLWRVDGGPATVGIIASVSHAFCSACDRTRLTADGQVRSCLFATEETDLRSAAAQRRRRRRARGGLARGDVAQGARSRHQRPRLRAAATPDERDRRLT
jgi:molybdenum cofactor biosynthesis enzyme MoaA